MALIIVILIVVVRALFDVFFGGRRIEGATTVFFIEQGLHEIVLLAGLGL